MNCMVDGRLEVGSSGPMPELPMGSTGVYETLLIRVGEPVFWREHWERFQAGCRTFDLSPAFQSESLRQQVAQLAKANGIGLGVARYAAWAGEGGTLRTRVDVSPPRPHMSRPAFKVLWGPVLDGIPPEPGCKHLRRIAWMEASKAARAAGADEALLHDAAGRLVEGGGSNVFFVERGVLHTPAVQSGALPGTMRAQVIKLAHELSWTVCQGSYGIAELEAAQEVWLTNAIIGVRHVVQLGERHFTADTPMLRRFRAEWQNRHGWDPVVVG